MRRSTDQKPEKSSAEAIHWPSVSFLWGAFKRQFLIASLVALPVLVAAVLILLNFFPWKYSSTIAVIFDTSESLNTGDNANIIASRIAGAYESAFSDNEFFENVSNRINKEKGRFPGEDKAGFMGGLVASTKAFIGDIAPKFQPASWTLPPEVQQRNSFIEEIKSSLSTTVIPAQFTLALTGEAADGADARDLVREAMSQFIEDELRRRQNQAKAKIHELSALEAAVLEEKEISNDGSLALNQNNSERSLDPEALELKKKEQKLVQETLLKIADFQRAQSTQENRILLLKDELNNLLSRKGLTHPDVMQKQREINKLEAEPVDAPIRSEVNRLKSQLRELQKSMKGKGLPIDRSVQIASFPDESRRTLTELTTQIRTLKNLVDDLERDIQKPWESRRFTVVRKAEASASPSNKKMFFAAAGAALAITGLTFLLTMLIREMNQPFVVAAEQMDRMYGVHPTAELKPSWLQRHSMFDAEQIRELRPQLGQLVSKKRPELVLLDAYRHIGQLVDQMQEHQVIVVFDTGAENHPDNLAANLIRVLTVDSGRRALFLSFRGRDSHSEENTADLMAFLAGKAEWKNVRLKGAADGSHDTAYARDPLESLGAFKEDLVLKLFKILREKYQVIVVEAFPPAFNAENGVLHQLADAVVLQVRLGETRHEDLQRLLQFMDRRKIAAALMS
jgi:hypothetical protein